MKQSDLILVKKEEIHCWKLCPCLVCEQERVRRAKPTKKSHQTISVSSAYALGFLKARRPCGSLARELMKP